METRINTLGYRQFMWGLSNGIIMLIVAGTFWLNMAAWTVSRMLIPPILAVAAGLGFGALRVRRLARGFRLAEAAGGDPRHQARTREIRVGFRWASIAQTIAIVITVTVCHQAGRDDLIWPCIALVVSLHFIAIAHLVRVRPYYVMAACGSIVATIAAHLPAGPRSVEFLGAGMGMVMWSAAAYVSWRADRLVQVWEGSVG